MRGSLLKGCDYNSTYHRRHMDIYENVFEKGVTCDFVFFIEK